MLLGKLKISVYSHLSESYLHQLFEYSISSDSSTKQLVSKPSKSVGSKIHSRDPDVMIVCDICVIIYVLLTLFLLKIYVLTLL